LRAGGVGLDAGAIAGGTLVVLLLASVVIDGDGRVDGVRLDSLVERFVSSATAGACGAGVARGAGSFLIVDATSGRGKRRASS